MGRYNGTTYRRSAMRRLNAPHFMHTNEKSFEDSKLRAILRDFVYATMSFSYYISHVSPMLGFLYFIC